MADKFVVYVSAPPPGEAEAAAQKLAELLKLDPRKVEALMRRLPDVVTRPVSEREADVAAKRFRQAGFAVEVRDAVDGRRVVTASERTPFSSAPPPPAVEWADEDEEALERPIIRPTFEDIDEAPLATDAPAPQDPAPSPAAFEADPFEESRLKDSSFGAGAFGSGGAGAFASTPAAAAPPEPPRAAPEPAPAVEPARDAAPDPSATAFSAPAGRASQPVSATTVGAPAVAPGATPARRERGARRRRGATDAAAAEGAKRRRGSLRSKLLSTAIIPVLLAIAGALAATWFTARPALYDQLLESARNPAIATAATLSSTLERAGPDGIDHLQLLETILITRQAFARQNLSFILATDTSGNPYSGSFLGGTSFPEESLALQNAVRERAVHAVQQGASGRSGWAEEGATSHVAAAGGQRIEIVAQPLMQGNTAIGAVVVGVTDQAVTQQVNRIVVNVLLFSLIPLLIAILIAAWRARRLTNNVLMLTRKADEISRGDLDEPVELRSNDELDDLSAALERMRVSMSGALERLRRRR